MQRGGTATTLTAMVAVPGVAVSTRAFAVASAAVLVVASSLYSRTYSLLISLSVLITLMYLVVMTTHA